MVVGLIGWAAFEATPSAADAPMSGHGVAALAIGVVATLAIGIGLMALVFWSSRRGYDDRAAGGFEPHPAPPRPAVVHPAAPDGSGSSRDS